MIKVKMFIAFAMMLGALLVSAAPAFAEFESKNGGSNQGKGEVYETVFEDGGATVTCDALEEGVSKAGWTVENKEGKAQKKGPDLLVKVTNWGKCQAKASGLKEIEAKVGECGIEIKQPEEQIKSPGAIATECIIHISTCEIKVGPKNNQSLKEFETAQVENTEEHTSLGLAISNLAVEVNEACVTDGIQKSSTVQVRGAGAVRWVYDRNIPLKWVVGVGKRFINVTEPTTAITITHSSGGLESLGNVRWVGLVTALFIPSGAEYTNCVTTKVYEVGNTCKFTIERNAPARGGSVLTFYVYTINNNRYNASSVELLVQ